MAGLLTFDDLPKDNQKSSGLLTFDDLPKNKPTSGLLTFDDLPKTAAQPESPTIADSLKTGWHNTRAGANLANAVEHQEQIERLRDAQLMQNYSGGAGEAARALLKDRPYLDHGSRMDDTGDRPDLPTDTRLNADDIAALLTGKLPEDQRTPVAGRMPEPGTLKQAENARMTHRAWSLLDTDKHQQAAADLPQHQGIQAFSETDGFGDAAKHLATNWGTAGHLILQSAYPMVEQLGQAAAGAARGGIAGAMIGSGQASARMNRNSKRLEEAQESGVGLREWIEDAAKRDAADITARKYAAPVAIADALSMGAAKYVAPFKSTPKNVALQGLAVQPALGAGGEAAGQLNAYGEIKSPHEVVAEGMLELPTGLIETAIATRGSKKRDIGDNSAIQLEDTPRPDGTTESMAPDQTDSSITAAPAPQPPQPVAQTTPSSDVEKPEIAELRGLLADPVVPEKAAVPDGDARWEQMLADELAENNAVVAELAESAEKPTSPDGAYDAIERESIAEDGQNIEATTGDSVKADDIPFPDDFYADPEQPAYNKNKPIEARGAGQNVPFSRFQPDSTSMDKSGVDWQALPDQREAEILHGAVNKHLTDNGKDGLDAGSFQAVQTPEAMRGAVDTLQQVFGKKVVFVKPGSEAASGLFQGAIVPSAAKNRIFVNTNADAGYMNVIGHELYEHLRVDRPDLHQYFREAAQVHYRNRAGYHQQLSQQAQQQEGVTLSRADTEKELLADFTGDALADSAFLRSLAKQNPGRFKQLAATIQRWLKSLVAKLQGRKTSDTQQFFNDVQALRQQLTGVLDSYAKHEDEAKGLPDQQAYESSNGENANERGIPNSRKPNGRESMATLDTGQSQQKMDAIGKNSSSSQATTSAPEAQKNERVASFADGRVPNDDSSFRVEGSNDGLSDAEKRLEVADSRALVHFMRQPPKTQQEAERLYQTVGRSIARQYTRHAPEWVQSGGAGLGRAGKRIKDSTAGGALNMMTFNGLVDRYAPIFEKVGRYNPLKKLEEHKRMMRAVTQHYAERFQTSHDGFMQLKGKQRDDVTLMMFDATMLNLKPDQVEYEQSIDVQWAFKKINSLEGEIKGIAADQRREPRNRAYTPEQAMHAHAKAKKSIQILNRKIEHENKRSDSWDEIRARWEAMSTEQQAVYHDWRDELTRLWEKQSDALEAKIGELQGLSPGDQKQARGLVTQMRAEYRKRMELGDYFPLRRYGKYHVLLKDPDGHYERAHFEHKDQADDFMQSMKAERPQAETLLLHEYKDMAGAAKDVPGVAGQLLGLLNQQGVEIDPQVRETFNQFIIESLPEVSARKPELRRWYVSGASKDMERSFAHAMLHGGHDLSRILYSHKVQHELDRIQEAISVHEGLMRGTFDDTTTKKEAAQEHAQAIAEKDLPQAGKVLNMMRKQVDGMMNPDTNALAAFAGNFGFLWHLAGSPLTGLINLMQTIQVTHPMLASRFGATASLKELNLALVDVMRSMKVPRNTQGRFDVRHSIFGTLDAKFLPDDERALLEGLQLDGTTDATMANALARTASGDGRSDVGSASIRMDKPLAYLGFFFHNAEVLNRQVSQLAAYRLHKKASKQKQAELDATHGSGTDFARWITERSHFDYKHANRSHLMKGNTAKTLTPLMNFSLMMTEWMLTRFKDSMPWSSAQAEQKTLARKELTHTMMSTMLLAGASGLPVGLVWGTANLLANLFGDDDEPYDAKTVWADWLRDVGGDNFEQVINRGAVNTATGLDLSSRVGLSGLIFRDPYHRDEGGEVIEAMAFDALGVLPSTISGFGQGFQYVGQGEYLKATEKFTPKFVRDPVRAYRYATEGMTTRKGDEVIAPEGFSVWELSAQATGMAPAQVTESYDRRKQLDTLKYDLQKRKRELMNRAKKFKMDKKGNWGEIQREIARFNRKNPHLKITRTGIDQSVKRSRKNREQKQGDHGLYLDKNMRATLQDKGYLD